MGKITLSEIYKVAHLLENAPDGDYRIILRDEDDNVEHFKQMAQDLNVFLYYPYEGRPYHWFIYEVPTKSTGLSIDIEVRGPYI
jgi:hypothetical protein